MHIQVCTHGHTHRQTDLHAHAHTHTVSLAKLQTHRRTCKASEGYCNWLVCLSVCLCECRRLFWHYRLRGGLWGIPATFELREPEQYKDDYTDTTVFERYAVKTSEKANMHYRFPRTDPLLWGSRSHTCINSRMLSTTVASPCLTLRELIAWRPQVNTYSWPNSLSRGTAHAQCAEGLHFSAFHYNSHT